MTGDDTSTASQRTDEPSSLEPRRQLPAVNDLVQHVIERGNVNRAQRYLIVEVARKVLDEHRAQLSTSAATTVPPATEELYIQVEDQVRQAQQPPLQPVINATGIIIHTGLGRAPLADAAVRTIADVAAGYAPVELEMESGKRSNRSTIVRSLLSRLTGAESATVVNNNAAALVLVLNELAKDRSVIVSRGELIEIGGSFRLPDVMKAGGAILREVGTTNRTRLNDYEIAIDESTAALMKVHPSNYRIEGFAQDVSIQDLVSLGRHHDLPVIHDIGSGLLGNVDSLSVLSQEPSATDSIQAGADLVLFSGDKLLGGPQAGIIVGSKTLIDRLEANPLMRALRVDKLTLAGLGATLQLHRDVESATTTVPVLKMLATPLDELQRRGQTLVNQIKQLSGIRSAQLVQSQAYLGGGAVPTESIPSCAIVLAAKSIDEQEFAATLRTGSPPILPRVSDGQVWLDLRTVFPDQDAPLLEALQSALQ